MATTVSPSSSSIQEERQPLVSHIDKQNEYGSNETQKPEDKSPKAKGLMSSLAVVYITVFIDLMGFGIIIPLLPYYAVSLGASGLWLGIIMSSYSVMQFLGATFLGRLSDKVGRRVIILLSLLGSTGGEIILGFSTSIWMLCLARGVAGLFGGSISVAQAYIADVTSPQDRAKYMGMLGASIGMGFVIGPAIGAGMSHWGFSYAAFVAAGISGLNLLIGIFVLKNPEKMAEKQSVPIAQTVLRKNIILCYLANFMMMIAFTGFEVTLGLLLDEHFHLKDLWLGVILSCFGVVMAIIQGGFVRPLKKHLGEKKMAVLGTLLESGLLFVIPLMPSIYSLCGVLGGLAITQSIISPAVPTLLSINTEPDRQGLVLGINQSFASIARMASPIIMGYVYDYNYRFPYMAAGILYLVAFFFFTFVSSSKKKETCPFHAFKEVAHKCPAFNQGCPYKNGVDNTGFQVEKCPAFVEGCPFGGKVQLEMKECPVFKQGCPFKEETAATQMQQTIIQAENFSKCPLSQHSTNATHRQPKKM